MKFLGDIPISRNTVEFLTARGHDAIRSVQHLAPTAADREIVQLAIAQQRILLCFDLDFSAIVARSGESRPSVITFRTKRRTAAYINSRLEAVLAEVGGELDQGLLVTVEEERIRVHGLPIRRSP
ncbi:MAG: DUF5615 family PIN-like protein [Deltaproteobacteria bacterium]|nr:DUF5615 family PIN-like protein [Deltaproteobacteria bacterium]